MILRRGALLLDVSHPPHCPILAVSGAGGFDVDVPLIGQLFPPDAHPRPILSVFAPRVEDVVTVGTGSAPFRFGPHIEPFVVGESAAGAAVGVSEDGGDSGDQGTVRPLLYLVDGQPVFVGDEGGPVVAAVV